jgi:hypothetical protein
MISLDKLEKNKKKFKEVNEEYNIFSSELEAFLGENFYISPASPSTDLYGCYPGGLLDHLIKVCKYCLLLNDLIPEKIKIPKEKLIKTSFLSQIGKVFLYKENPSEWHRLNQGKLYVYSDITGVAMRSGERSVYYAIKYGVELSEIEYQAILNSDKESFERFVRWKSEPLSHIIKMGFELALMEEKYGAKKN